MTYLEKAQTWTQAPFDTETQEKVNALIQTNSTELEDAFYKDLEFGTGGMRGVMGVGTNRLNKYTIGAATQGLANYLNQQFTGKISVAIAYDVRHNSDTFAQLVADILSANRIHVYLFDNFRPTPELSFTVRHLNCQAGIVLTASHNPPEYNGYKVYWNDGGQIVPPHDSGIINEVKKVEPKDIKFEGNADLIHSIGEEIDQTFYKASVKHGDVFGSTQKDLKIVFTSIHGTSVHAIPAVLKKAGFNEVHIVEEQAVPSGDFPTVKSPNPEEPEALAMALELANKTNADIVIGTDPDADRIGIGVRNLEGEMVLLNGNQCNTVIADAFLKLNKENGELSSNHFIGSTVVSSDIFLELAAEYGVQCSPVLTGFKWIGDQIAKSEGEKTFVCGGEESFGFMIGDFVRDKDSVTTALAICEIANRAKNEGSSYYNELLKIYSRLNCYQEELNSIVKKGKQGAEEISNIMKELRANPPKSLAGSPLVEFHDLKESTKKNLQTNEKLSLDLPKSNVLIFYTEDGSKVAARPSGTEPKIKFYYSVKAPLDNPANYDKVKAELQAKINKLKEEFSF